MIIKNKSAEPPFASNATNAQALCTAAEKEDNSALSILLQKPDRKQWIDLPGDLGGHPALHLAVLKPSDRLGALVERLLDAGANVNAKNRAGLSILHIAAWSGYDDKVKFLLNRKDIDPNIIDETVGATPLHMAVSMAQEGVVKQLLDDKRVNVNAQDNAGNTPLHCAAKNGNKSLVALLEASPRVSRSVENKAHEIYRALIHTPRGNRPLQDESPRAPSRF